MEDEWEKVEYSGNPPIVFGHTAVLLGKTRIVLYGGAIEYKGQVIMTNTTYIYAIYKNEWTKLERILLSHSSYWNYTMSKSSACSNFSRKIKDCCLWRSYWQ